MTIVVRDVGKLKPDYSLDFDLPAVPSIGTYLSIQRPDHPEPYGEDLVVRQVWWRLAHPETGAVATEPAKVGGLTEIFVECDQAIGPYSSDAWRDRLVAARQRGAEVTEFEVARVSIRQDAFTR